MTLCFPGEDRHVKGTGRLLTITNYFIIDGGGSTLYRSLQMGVTSSQYRLLQAGGSRYAWDPSTTVEGTDLRLFSKDLHPIAIRYITRFLSQPQVWRDFRT